jgi:hypothetical protein
MLISHRHRFIFIHLWKTAGTSVRRALDPYVEGRWRRRVAGVTRRLGLPFPRTDPIHLAAPEVRERVGPEVYDRYFAFGFVRNPWDWQVSLYHWTLAHPEHFQHDFVRQLGGFDPYIRWRVEKEVRLEQTFFADAEGRLLVDYVGRIETLQDDFAEICRSIGLPAVTLPHANASRPRDYRTFYTDETRELVAQTFADDIALFRYDFDGPAAPGPLRFQRRT